MQFQWASFDVPHSSAGFVLLQQQLSRQNAAFNLMLDPRSDSSKMQLAVVVHDATQEIAGVRQHCGSTVMLAYNSSMFHERCTMNDFIKFEDKLLQFSQGSLQDDTGMLAQQQISPRLETDLQVIREGMTALHHTLKNLTALQQEQSRCIERLCTAFSQSAPTTPTATPLLSPLGGSDTLHATSCGKKRFCRSLHGTPVGRLFTTAKGKSAQASSFEKLLKIGSQTPTGTGICKPRARRSSTASKSLQFLENPNGETSTAPVQEFPP